MTEQLDDYKLAIVYGKCHAKNTIVFIYLHESA